MAIHFVDESEGLHARVSFCRYWPSSAGDQLACSVKAKKSLQETYYQISAWRSCAGAGAGKSANGCSFSRPLEMFKTVTALQNQPHVVIQTPAACVLNNHASTHTPLTAIPTERCKSHGPLPVRVRFYGASWRTAENGHSSLSENHFYAVTGTGGWGDKIGTHSRVLNGGGLFPGYAAGQKTWRHPSHL